MNPCVVEGCRRRAWGREKYCWGHRYRARRRGDLERPWRKHPNRWQALMAAVYAYFEADIEDPAQEKRVRNRLRLAAIRYAATQRTADSR